MLTIDSPLTRRDHVTMPDGRARTVPSVVEVGSYLQLGYRVFMDGRTHLSFSLYGVWTLTLVRREYVDWVKPILRALDQYRFSRIIVKAGGDEEVFADARHIGLAVGASPNRRLRAALELVWEAQKAAEVDRRFTAAIAEMMFLEGQKALNATRVSKALSVARSHWDAHNVPMRMCEFLRVVGLPDSDVASEAPTRERELWFASVECGNIESGFIREGTGDWVFYRSVLDEWWSSAARDVVASVRARQATPSPGSALGDKQTNDDDAAVNDDLVQRFVPVVERELGGLKVLTVVARDMWTFLGAARNFSNWFEDQKARCRLRDGVDFDERVLNENVQNSSGGRPRRDYLLSIDAAKEIGMSDKGLRGKELRQYFIDCERRLVERDGTVTGKLTG